MENGQLDYLYNESKRKAESFCGSKAVVLEGKTGDKHGVFCHRIRCNSWYCTRCAPRKLKKLKARLYQFIGKKYTRLMTLTTRYTNQPIDLLLIDLSRDWDILLKRIKRKYGKVQYFKIVQFHKNGAPHLHCLIDKFIDQNWLSDQWSEIHNSPIVDIRFMDNHHAINYVSKYISKELEAQSHFHALFQHVGRRRFAFSRNGNFTPFITDHVSLTSLFAWRDRHTMMNRILEGAMKAGPLELLDYEETDEYLYAQLKPT